MPHLKLLFTRILFGRFSYSYQATFRKNRTPNHRKRYQRACSRTDPLNHYVAIAKEKPVYTSYKGTGILNFNQIEFGLGFSKVRQKNGIYHCYDVVNYKSHLWSRIGYKERIFHASAKRIYHFIDNTFFFGEISFSDLRQVDFREVIRVLLEKYTSKKDNIPEGDLRIDFENGFIYVENTGISLSVKYISTEFPEVNAALDKILGTRENNS